MADVILMVIVLDLTCLRNTARLLNLFQQFEGMVERVKLVVNRVGSAEPEISLKKAEETLQDADLLADPDRHQAVPERADPGVPIERGRLGQPVASGHPRDRPRAPARPLRATEKPRKGLFAAFF